MTNAVNLASAAGTGFFRNKLINGGFDVWQRGTSAFGIGGNTYNADRWTTILIDYAGGGASFERGAFSTGQTTVPNNPAYFIRLNNTNLTTGVSGLLILEQRIEDVSSLSGQTITISGWARRSSGSTIAVQVNQDFGSGGSSAVVTNFTTPITVSSSWAFFTRTVTIPSTSGKTVGSSSYTAIRLVVVDKAGFAGTVIGDMASSSTVDFAQMQLEVGSVSTPFERRLYGQELALCQRYYTLLDFNVDGFHSFYGEGATNSASTFFAVKHQFPVTMRATPTFVSTATFTTVLCSAVANLISPSSHVTQFGASNSANNRTYAHISSGKMTWSAEL